MCSAGGSVSGGRFDGAEAVDSAMGSSSMRTGARPPCCFRVVDRDADGRRRGMRGLLRESRSVATRDGVIGVRTRAITLRVCETLTTNHSAAPPGTRCRPRRGLRLAARGGRMPYRFCRTVYGRREIAERKGWTRVALARRSKAGTQIERIIRIRTKGKRGRWSASVKALVRTLLRASVHDSLLPCLTSLALHRPPFVKIRLIHSIRVPAFDSTHPHDWPKGQQDSLLSRQQP